MTSLNCYLATGSVYWPNMTRRQRCEIFRIFLNRLSWKALGEYCLRDGWRKKQVIRFRLSTSRRIYLDNNTTEVFFFFNLFTQLLPVERCCIARGPIWSFCGPLHVWNFKAPRYPCFVGPRIRRVPGFNDFSKIAAEDRLPNIIDPVTYLYSKLTFLVLYKKIQKWEFFNGEMRKQSRSEPYNAPVASLC